VFLSDLLKRPEINKEDIKHFIDKKFAEDIYEQLEIKVKYEGYIQKALREAEKMQRLDHKKLPDSLDYNKISNISSESREKLIKIRPKTLGQASRISGVNPADISLLLIYLESESRHKNV
jgi:tRNA uridine 5-carboxymethylaminomethyl modification enzyme